MPELIHFIGVLLTGLVFILPLAVPHALALIWKPKYKWLAMVVIIPITGLLYAFARVTAHIADFTEFTGHAPDDSQLKLVAFMWGFIGSALAASQHGAFDPPEPTWEDYAAQYKAERERRQRVNPDVAAHKAPVELAKVLADAMRTLGIDRRDLDRLSPDELQSAWRKTAARTHPDAGGSPEDFRRAKEAYDFLISWIEAQAA